MAKGILHSGLTAKSPKAPGGSDLPIKMGEKTTVNEGTRDSVAPTPKTLGPRDA